jgi:GNAT superfamily N-acetyltransferase
MNGLGRVSIESLGPSDVDIVKWVVYTAVSWNDPPGLPPFDVAMEHPRLILYHQGWGRPGDFGVRADVGDVFAGAAFARQFSHDEHGEGYVDAQTPELGIAVEASFRGRGVGRLLMNSLAAEARRIGFERLSLSVNNPNPAKRLYEAVGYTLYEDDGTSSIMVLDL